MPDPVVPDWIQKLRKAPVASRPASVSAPIVSAPASAVPDWIQKMRGGRTVTQLAQRIGNGFTPPPLPSKMPISQLIGSAEAAVKAIPPHRVTEKLPFKTIAPTEVAPQSTDIPANTKWVPSVSVDHELAGYVSRILPAVNAAISLSVPASAMKLGERFIGNAVSGALGGFSSETLPETTAEINRQTSSGNALVDMAAAGGGNLAGMLGAFTLAPEVPIVGGIATSYERYRRGEESGPAAIAEAGLGLATLGAFSKMNAIASGAVRVAAGVGVSLGSDVAAKAIHGELPSAEDIPGMLGGAAVGGLFGVIGGEAKISETEGELHATQEGNIAENSIDEHPGIPHREDLPENGSEIRESEGQQASGSGGAVGETPVATAITEEKIAPPTGPIVTPESSPDEENAIRAGVVSTPDESTVIPSGVDGREFAEDHGAQPEAMPVGVSPHGDDREYNTEGPGARGENSTGDRGDESVGQGGSREGEGVSGSEAPKESAGVASSVPVRLFTHGIGDQVLVGAPDDFVGPREERVTDREESSFTGKHFYKTTDGAWHPEEHLVAAPESAAPPQPKTLSERQERIQAWRDVESEAPGTPREYILRDIANGAKLSRQDANRDIFGSHLKKSEQNRNFLSTGSSGKAHDLYVKAALEDFYPNTVTRQNTADLESEWMNELRDVVQSTSSSKHARDILIDQRLDEKKAQEKHYQDRIDAEKASEHPMEEGDVHDYALPPDLAKMNPRYSQGYDSNYGVKFDSDFDKASYLASSTSELKRRFSANGTGKSNPRIAAVVADVEAKTGVTAQELRQHGKQVKAAMKGIEMDDNTGTMRVPKQPTELRSKVAAPSIAEPSVSRIESKASTSEQSKVPELEATPVLRKPEVTEPPIELPPNAREPQFGGENSLPSNVTGLRKSVVDAERAKRGQPPIEDPLEKAFGVSWGEGKEKESEYQSATGKSAAEELAAEIAKKPRALDDVDVALLSQHKVKLRNGIDRSYADANDEKLSAEQRLNARAMAQLGEERLDEFDLGVRPSMTKTARGLSAMQMLAADDGSLYATRAKWKAAKNGTWTDVDEHKLTSAYANIEALNGKLADAESRANAARSGDVFQSAFDDFVKHIQRESKKGGRSASQVVGYLDRRADAARARFKARAGQLSAGIDPQSFLDLVDIGASHIAHGAVDLAEWSKRMIGEVGDWVRPHLGRIFSDAKSLHDAQMSGAKSVGRSPHEVAANLEVAGDRPTQKQVFDVYRAHVNAGITDPNEATRASMGSLQNKFPGITERETRDVFTGYGHRTELSPAKDLQTLRQFKGYLRNVSTLENILNGKRGLKTGQARERPTEEQKALEKRVREEMVNAGFTEPPKEGELSSQLDRYKTQLANQTRDIQARRVASDYTKRTPVKTTLDQTAEGLLRERNRQQIALRDEIEQDRLKNRSPGQKFWDRLPAMARLNVLTHLSSIPKIGAFSLSEQGVALFPDEGIGYVASKLFPSIAERAPVEGRTSAKQIGAAINGLFGKDGLGDAILAVRGKRTTLELSDPKPIRLESKEFAGIVGRRLHLPLHAIARMSKYKQSVQAQLEHAAFHGENVNDPEVQRRIHDYANTYSKIVSMTEPNWASKLFNMIRTFSRSRPIIGPGLERAEKIALPISTVGGNVVNLASVRMGGWLDAGARIAWAKMHGAIAEMPPEQADLIMRHLKKGWVGPATVLLGALAGPTILTKHFGGFYVGGEKRDPSDLRPDDIEINGYRLPHWAGVALSHTFLFGVQAGATIAREYAKQREGGEDTLGATRDAFFAGSLGIAGAVPLVSLVSEMGKAINSPNGMTKYVGEYLKTLAVPGVVQDIASWTDNETDAAGEPVRRETNGIMQRVERGIPGLRETLPVEEKRVSELMDESNARGGITAVQSLLSELRQRGVLTDKQVETLQSRVGETPAERKTLHGALKNSMSNYARLRPQDRQAVRSRLMDRLNALDEQGSRSDVEWSALKRQAAEIRMLDF